MAWMIPVPSRMETHVENRGGGGWGDTLTHTRSLIVGVKYPTRLHCEHGERCLRHRGT